MVMLKLIKFVDKSNIRNLIAANHFKFNTTKNFNLVNTIEKKRLRCSNESNWKFSSYNCQYLTPNYHSFKSRSYLTSISPFFQVTSFPSFQKTLSPFFQET